MRIEISLTPFGDTKEVREEYLCKRIDVPNNGTEDISSENIPEESGFANKSEISLVRRAIPALYPVDNASLENLFGDRYLAYGPPVINPGSKALTEAFTAIAATYTGKEVPKLSREARNFMECTKVEDFPGEKSYFAVAFCKGYKIVLTDTDTSPKTHYDCRKHRVRQTVVFIGMVLPYSKAVALLDATGRNGNELTGKMVSIFTSVHDGRPPNLDLFGDYPIAMTIDGKTHIMEEGDAVADPKARIVYELKNFGHVLSFVAGQVSAPTSIQVNLQHAFYHNEKEAPQILENWPEPYRLGWPRGSHSGILAKLEKAG